MRFLQIHYPHSPWHDPYKYYLCKGNRKSRHIVDRNENSWTYEKPSTNIFNSFYLELIK